jgi:hypothetical protein
MSLPFFQWVEATPLGHWLAQSIWSFAVIEAVHLVGLSLLGGSLLIVDLRLRGLGLRRQPISEIGGHAHRWLVWATAIMLGTGLLLFISEPIKLYYNQSFWVKMWTLPVALAFTFTLRRRVVRAGTEADWKTRLVAVASIGLWFTVAAAGRWIGFSS